MSGGYWHCQAVRWAGGALPVEQLGLPLYASSSLLPELLCGQQSHICQIPTLVVRSIGRLSKQDYVYRLPIGIEYDSTLSPGYENT